MGRFLKAMFSIIALSFALVACAQPGPQQSHYSQGSALEQSKPQDNLLTKTINPLLGEQTTTQSTLQLFSSFRDYAVSRIQEQEPDSLSSQSKQEDSVIEEFKKYVLNLDVEVFALKEYNTRTSKHSADHAFVTVEELVSYINYTGEGQLDVSVTELETVQKNLRLSFPQLAVNPKSTDMTYFEAILLSWSVITGDDGSAAVKSLNIDMDYLEKLNKVRTEQLTAQDCGATVFVALTIIFAVDKTVQTIQGKDGSIFESIIDFLNNPFGINSGNKDGGNRSWTYYYNSQDMFQTLNILNSGIVFDNSSPPGDVAVVLPGKPLRDDDYIAIASTDFGKTFHYDSDEKYEQNKVRLYTQATQTDDGKRFDQTWWNAKQRYFMVGDIAFFRRDDGVGKLLAFLSTWTHVALAANPAQSVFYESVPAHHGVFESNPISDWEPAIAFSVRRFKPYLVDTKTINKIVSNASKYVDTYYFPETIKLDANRIMWANLGITSVLPFAAVDALVDWVKRWASKYDSDSMYCSKFIWRACIEAGVDIDSNRTMRGSHQRFNERWKQQVFDELINELFDSSMGFIGVTPDEIYYSDLLGPDIPELTFGLENLQQPLSAASVYRFSPLPLTPGEVLIENETILSDRELRGRSVRFKGSRIGNSAKINVYQDRGVDFESRIDIQKGAYLDIHHL